jgi:hypothetical protein
MQTVEDFSAIFPSYLVLPQARANSCNYSRLSGVQILQGPDETGKGIIFYTQGPVGSKALHAFVVNTPRLGKRSKEQWGEDRLHPRPNKRSTLFFPTVTARLRS